MLMGPVGRTQNVGFSVGLLAGNLGHAVVATTLRDVAGGIRSSRPGLAISYFYLRSRANDNR